MGGNYQKGMYDQLMEVMQKLDFMEAEHKKDRKEIRSLQSEVTSLKSENAKLLKKAETMQAAIAELTDENAQLRAENELLRNDIERRSRKDSNNSRNSSVPPSKDENPGKPANMYNSRKETKKKQGAQPGHIGKGLSRADVEKHIKDGTFKHCVKTIGSGIGKFITRYRLDLEIFPVATEVRIYPDENGKYTVPDDMKGFVTYGDTIRAIAAFLYGEGVVSNDRIAEFIRAISGDTVNISEGSIYNFCRTFSNACEKECRTIEEKLLDAYEICTDATVIDTNGKQSYIRNFSTDDYVLYCGSNKKDLDTLKTFRILREFAGKFTHDHETALYHFGTDHAECNVHIGRYLLKNTEETGNRWSHDMTNLLLSINAKRNKLIEQGIMAFRPEQIDHIWKRYDEILANGFQANTVTKGKLAREEEKKLLNRLKKYKENHLLFVKDFRIHYSNNMSEKDLRICKNRQKMAGGFRTVDGRAMYCRIMSVIETMKRKKINIFQGIIALLTGRLVIC